MFFLTHFRLSKSAAVVLVARTWKDGIKQRRNQKVCLIFPLNKTNVLKHVETKNE